MRNPNGSDIFVVRRIIADLINGKYGTIDDVASTHLAFAYIKSFRASPLRKADIQQRIPITVKMKQDIFSVSGDMSLSNADIAELVGLPKCASGRVTEVLQGLR